MSKYRVRVPLSLDPSKPLPVRPQRDDFESGAPWPLRPDQIVRIEPADQPYPVAVDVELARSEGGYVVTGIAIRRTFPMKPQARSGPATEPRPLEGTEALPLSPRDVRRMPLATYVRAALEAVSGAFDDERPERIGRAMVPRGRPQRGRGTAFYREVLDAYRDLLVGEGRGNAVKEIARRKNVDPNLVHQWLYRARQLEEKQASDTKQQQSKRRKR